VEVVGERHGVRGLTIREGEKFIITIGLVGYNS